ncbi:MAG: hypothetical protein COV07_01655 [Candidatus Vogelbacteria bacterium CG10_big_fil_rev_8_21_14_0_10_45_14]|uniref:PIN domain-containing protein n=1 Tax=Candidatus Vogelbacteria bacterium CG10_big_fil_rev_8_21_14_0_10_45_14 TaxID=1975042 RepID=A0A2H0RKG4_9BACT|nr:MAG: hypothetical protein COV07_01655 [Candidatus Vogelbacteria bacterium CG10_big_fil_rev_8_21_14_0_10_45_14]
MTIFDSSVWVAFFDESDSLHARARREATKSVLPILLPDVIALETATVLLRKGGKGLADIFLKNTIWNKDVLSITNTIHGLRTWAQFYISLQDKKLSPVDTILLQLSSGYEILTYDKALARAIRKRRGKLVK